MTYELHPLCTLFPRMAGGEFASLRDDIQANGLRQPIVLHDGMILDGGNRYRACIEAGVEPVFAEFDGGSLVAFVLSANLHRRHMSAGQQAAIVASAQDWATAQGRGGDRKTDQSATLHFDSAAARASESGASLRTQKMADKVAKADPALSRKVAHGEVSLPKALAQVEGKHKKPKAEKPKTAAQQAEQQRQEDAYGDTDPLELLEQLQADNERMTGELQAVEADDLKAEALKWRRAYDSATRAQSEAMDRAAKYQKELDWFGRQMKRIGKAVGEDDPTKVAAVVEALVRNNLQAAA